MIDMEAPFASGLGCAADGALAALRLEHRCVGAVWQAVVIFDEIVDLMPRVRVSKFLLAFSRLAAKVRLEPVFYHRYPLPLFANCRIESREAGCGNRIGAYFATKMVAALRGWIFVKFINRFGLVAGHTFECKHSYSPHERYNLMWSRGSAVQGIGG